MGYKPCKTTHLAAILAALETQQTSAATTISPTLKGQAKAEHK